MRRLLLTLRGGRPAVGPEGPGPHTPAAPLLVPSPGTHEPADLLAALAKRLTTELVLRRQGRGAGPGRGDEDLAVAVRGRLLEQGLDGFVDMVPRQPAAATFAEWRAPLRERLAADGVARVFAALWVGLAAADGPRVVFEGTGPETVAALAFVLEQARELPGLRGIETTPEVWDVVVAEWPRVRDRLQPLDRARTPLRGPHGTADRVEEPGVEPDRTGPPEDTDPLRRGLVDALEDTRAEPTAPDSIDRARSAAEAFLFSVLERRDPTRGRFVLNETLPASPGFVFGNRPCIVDLLNARDMVAIEIDGHWHFQDQDAWRRDRRKDVLMQRHGLLVLRFLAEDVATRLEEILASIDAALDDR